MNQHNIYSNKTVLHFEHCFISADQTSTTHAGCCSSLWWLLCVQVLLVVVW